MTQFTRQKVKQMEYTDTMPIMMDGMLKRAEETFITPNGQPTAQEALKQLAKIQEEHPEAYGWRTLPDHEGVFQDEDGMWYSFRHHARYYR